MVAVNEREELSTRWCVHTDIDHFILHMRVFCSINPKMRPGVKAFYILKAGDSDIELLNLCGPEPLRILL